MLPKKELNIYPNNQENITALVSFYFDRYNILDKEEGILLLVRKTSLSLNQKEFIVRKLSEAFVPVFQKELKGDISLKNLLGYGFGALTDDEKTFTGLKPRIAIKDKFKKFVQHTEVDYDFLERNN